MTLVISTKITTGVVLNNSTTQNPATITATGYVSNTGDAIYGEAGFAWAVDNFGTVDSKGTSGIGILLQSGGSVTNGSSSSTAALIEGGLMGVYIGSSAGTVTNFGTIEGIGNGGAGVYLDGGSTVTNRRLIEGNDAVKISEQGIGGMVVNSGTILGTGTSSSGIILDQGGSVSNTGLIKGSQGVSSNYAGGAAAPGIITNSGTILGTAGVGIHLGGGGDLTNQAGGTISGSGGSVYVLGGPGTVTNAGSIVGGVWLQTVGAVTNQAGGAIYGNTPSGGYGVGFYDGGRVTNAGNISGLLVGIDMGSSRDTLGGSGTVTNEAGGTIDGRYAGILMGFPGEAATEGGGSLTNLADGTISGDDGVITGGRAVTITNAGFIAGTTAGTVNHKGIVFALGDGVYVGAGGVVTNQTGGSITGVTAGVYLASSSGTVTNAGTITGSVGIAFSSAASSGTVTNGGTIVGTTGTAVSFGGGNDLLIVDAGAVFSGAVDGGGGTNKVEFAAAGTDNITGFRGFETIVLASTGANSLTLANTNFGGVTGASITVVGGNAGNTVNAAGLTGANRVIVVGGAGVDHFTGGAGNDVFEFTAAKLAATDTVVGGLGRDELLMTTAGTVAAGGVSGVEIYHLANGGANSLTLTNTNFGAVTGASITVFGGSAGNTVNAAALTGTNRILVHAGSAADTLTGGAGNDFFYAGGDTKMTGRVGTNFFVFSAAGANNTVTDFATGSTTNRLVFSNAAFNLGQSGATAAPQLLVNGSTLFVANATGGFTSGSQRLAYDTANGELFSSTDGNLGASHLVATLTGHPTVGTTHLFFVT